MAKSPRFGVFVPQGWKMDLVRIDDPVEQYNAMSRAAQEAERLGFDSVWLYDHFHTVPTPEIETTFECWTSTAALARDTTSIRIGQMVTCNAYRNPAYLAKVASTVDVLSQGRLDFGIGAGWYEHEWRAYGYGFPDAPTRLKMLGEALPIIHSMWTDEYASYEGKFYTINGAINEPKGVQKPHPPIWIGGGGEKVTLKLVAKYGDASNFGGSNLDEFRRKAEILRQHCETVGRDYEEITKSASLEDIFLLGPDEMSRADEITAPYRRGASFEDYRARTFVGTSQELVDRVGPMLEAGVEYVLFYLKDIAYDLAPMQRLAEEVLPKLRS